MNIFTTEELEELIMGGKVTKKVKFAAGKIKAEITFVSDRERDEINEKNMKKIKEMPEEKIKGKNINTLLDRMFTDETIKVSREFENDKFIPIILSEMNSSMADAIINKKNSMATEIWNFMLEEAPEETLKK